MSEVRGGDNRLTEREVERFHERGFVGPFTAVSPEEMEAVRRHVESEVLGSDDGPWEGVPDHDRHRDARPLYELYSHPAIVDRMASLYGEDLLLWATHLWNKGTGDPEVPWHQDHAGAWTQYIEPPVNVSAWIAIDEAAAENGCVEIVPGSHRRRVQHVDAPEEATFDEMADPDAFDAERAVEMELAPGEFFLFTERTIHRSARNGSDRRRLGTSMRVVPAFVSVSEEELYDGYAAMPLRGDYDRGLNRLERPDWN